MVQNQANRIYVLDSFAAFAVLKDEPGAPMVLRRLDQARQGEIDIAMSVINLGEVVYKTIRERSYDEAVLARVLVEAWPVTLIDVDARLALAAADIKGSYALSYADCIAAALALQLEGSVVTGDPEFHKIEHLVPIDWLPQRP